MATTLPMGPTVAVTWNVAIRLSRSRYVIQGACRAAAGQRLEVTIRGVHLISYRLRRR